MNKNQEYGRALRSISRSREKEMLNRAQEWADRELSERAARLDGANEIHRITLRCSAGWRDR